jgi:hypothetical protein
LEYRPAPEYPLSPATDCRHHRGRCLRLPETPVCRDR